MQRFFRGLLGVCAVMLTLGPLSTRAAITLPHDNDDYSNLVARAEADDQSVDFHALRFGWLRSAARKRATPTADLNQRLKQAVAATDASAVLATAEQLISIDYTDMGAHKFRRQACHILGDATCEQHEHFVEFGLLNSITAGKDGRTAASAWEVASIKEEYFMIAMAGLVLRRQSLVNFGGRAYDQMDCADQTGAPHQLFFDITTLLPNEF